MNRGIDDVGFRTRRKGVCIGVVCIGVDLVIDVIWLCRRTPVVEL